MSLDTPTIRVATQADSESMIDILSEAFRDDPVFQWLSPKPSYARYAFGMTLPSCVPHGLSYLTEDGSGAASWLPPGIGMDPSITVGQFWEGVTRHGFRSLRRAYGVFRRVQKYHPTEDHYYLFAIGCHPAHRGSGVGSALMREVTRLCDEGGVPAYLENSKEQNLHFYRKHGFEVMNALQLENGPKMWPMLRTPR